ncbi:hypothetical protein GCM10023350_47710 [Nocardioides endophyticus]|uniref:MFS transporter n=1 Tax=Nocardioides endophyticus TaxID=1353775 RepID=A0ABP8ZHG8_9ACTN
MTTITATAPAAVSSRVSWRSGLVTVVGGAVSTTLVALVLQAIGVGLEVGGEPIPALGFTQMVALGGVIGVVLARHLGRTAYLRTTVVLTALSCVPSLALGDTVADKLGLVLTHVVAAAIIVPRLARH